MLNTTARQNTTPRTVLVVEDEPTLATAIAQRITAEGWTARVAGDGASAVQAASQLRPDLVIMDIMLPVMDGLEATKRIVAERPVPVLILTARDDEADKVIGLGAGADDYMTKPFQPAELIARVKSQLRRYTSLGGMYQNQTPAATVYQTGELIVDDASKTVTVDGEPVSLTPREYGILCFLTQHAGQVFSISQIYEAVWQEPAYNSENTVAVHIRRIREKIEINPKEPKYLKVVWGIGYKMEKLHPKQLG